MIIYLDNMAHMAASLKSADETNYWYTFALIVDFPKSAINRGFLVFFGSKISTQQKCKQTFSEANSVAMMGVISTIRSDMY